MGARRVVLPTPSEPLHPTQLLSRQQSVSVSPLAATLMNLLASVANKRLTARLNPLAATLTKNRGVGAPPCASDKDAHPESANGGGVEGFFSGLTPLYSSAPRAFQNSFVTKRFRTLSQNCRGVALQFPFWELFAGHNAERSLFSSFPFSSLHTLPSSVSCKSCICHSCENRRVYTNNSHSGTLPTLRITDHFSIQHTPTRNFGTLISSSPTILGDMDNWPGPGDSAEEFVTSSDTFDLIVIGCGPAGEKGGAQAAYFGKRVAVIERAEHMGGSCINTGTVPSKTLRESALYFSGLKQRGLYGIDYSLKENLTVHDFMHHEREVVEMERQRILKNLALHNIELVRGQAAFLDPHTVAVSGAQGKRQLKGEVIIISTGSKPHRPPEIAFDDIHTFDSDTFLQMDRIPKSLAVIGGGVIGCEYASIFKALGVESVFAAD